VFLLFCRGECASVEENSSAGERDLCARAEGTAMRASTTKLFIAMFLLSAPLKIHVGRPNLTGHALPFEEVFVPVEIFNDGVFAD